MNIIISHTSMEPIYEQIVRQIRAKIIDGSLKEKEPLPSVRTLSRELKISALTVKKAYDFLDEEKISRDVAECIYRYRSWKGQFCGGSQPESASGRTAERSGGGSGECDPERTVRRPF